MLGLLLLNKPEGITSFGAVACIKKLTGEKRVGHTGTLDPMATGVLPILIGRATVLSQYLIDADKSYSATVKLGITTDTCDITGNVLSQSTVDGNIDLEAVLKKFIGKQMQTPPMFSAIKQNGVRMYELARRGESVEIPAREIEIFSLSQTSPISDTFEFDIDTTVSKGTYIRTLCKDIGEALGCGGCMESLRRVSAGEYTIDEAVPLDALLEIENPEQYLRPVDSMFRNYPAVTLSPKQETRCRNGNSFTLNIAEGTYRVYGQDGEFLALCRTQDGKLTTVKSFF